VSISSTIRKVGPYLTNGSTTEFVFGFKVFQKQDLYVIKQDVATGSETVLTLYVDYDVELSEDQNVSPGGKVVISPALSSGYRLTISSDVEILQPTNLTNQGGFYPTVINDSLDKLTIISQQIKEQVDRGLRFPISDAQSLKQELPPAFQRAGKVLSFDEDGEPTTEILVDSVEVAQNAAISAASSAELSEDWAIKTDGSVGGTSEYSSKEYAVGVLRRGQTGGGSAKDWASYTSGTVDGTLYSAKYYADQAQSAINSVNSALSSIQATADSVVWSDVVFINSNTTLSQSSQGKLYVVDASAGSVTITLPVISTLNLIGSFAIGIKKQDQSGNAVLINRSGSDVFDNGSIQKSLSAFGSSTTLVPDTDRNPDTWVSLDFGQVGGNVITNSFSANGTQNSFTLSVAPGVKENTQVYIDGVYQNKSAYSLSGTTITLGAPPSAGVNNVEVVIGSTLTLGAPNTGSVTTSSMADASVTSSKMADGSVTTPKIADGAVTASKLASGILTSGTSPTGSVIAFAGIAAPSGWLMCDGATYSSTQYPDLAAVLGVLSGNFTVPDLRGQFIRGVDNMQTARGAAGVDSGRSIRSSQAQSTLLPAHRHGIDAIVTGAPSNGNWGGASNDFSLGMTGIRDFTSATFGNGAQGFYRANRRGVGVSVVHFSMTSNGNQDATPRLVNGSSDPSVGPSTLASDATGSETRPTNIAMSYIIKT